MSNLIVPYCIVPSGVIIEAEAGMTVYDQCWWDQISSTQCTAPLNVCKVCVLCEWCAAADHI